MTHYHTRLLSCVVFFAISTNSCHGSNSDHDLELPPRTSSYSASFSSALSDAFSSFLGGFSALIKKSSVAAARSSHLTEDAQARSQWSPLSPFRLIRGYGSGTISPHLLREINKDFTWHTNFFLKPPLQTHVPVSVTEPTSTDLDVNSQFSEEVQRKLRKSLQKFKKNTRVYYADAERDWLETTSVFSSKDDFDVLQEKYTKAAAQISILEEEHKKEVSVLKRVHVEKEVIYLQEIYLLKQQLHAVLQTQSLITPEFNPDQYIEENKYVKQYIEEQKMDEDGARLFAQEHYNLAGSSLTQFTDNKDDETNATEIVAASSSVRASMIALDTLPEDLRIYLLDHPEIIFETVKNGFNLEEYTRLYIKTNS